VQISSQTNWRIGNGGITVTSLAARGRKSNRPSSHGGISGITGRIVPGIRNSVFDSLIIRIVPFWSMIKIARADFEYLKWPNFWIFNLSVNNTCSSVNIKNLSATNHYLPSFHPLLLISSSTFEKCHKTSSSPCLPAVPCILRNHHFFPTRPLLHPSHSRVAECKNWRYGSRQPRSTIRWRGSSHPRSTESNYWIFAHRIYNSITRE